MTNARNVSGISIDDKTKICGDLGAQAAAVTATPYILFKPFNIAQYLTLENH